MRVLSFLLLFSLVFSQTCFAEFVSGYYKKNGTYVNGYNRSSGNSSVRDNYSYKGNSNPYTGETGSNYYRNDTRSEYYGTSSNRGSNSGWLN